MYVCHSEGEGARHGLSAFEWGMVVGVRRTGFCQELQRCWAFQAQRLLVCIKQWRLLRGGRHIIMARTAQMEWHAFDEFDTLPLIPLQSLPRAPMKVPPTCGVFPCEREPENESGPIRKPSYRDHKH